MDDPKDRQSFGVFFSNLEDEVPEMAIVAMIISFIFQMTGILVQQNDVRMRHSYPSSCNLANVDLHNPAQQQRTVEKLQQLSKHDTPKGLVKSGRALRVDYYQPWNLEGAPMRLPAENQTTGKTYLVMNQKMGNETRSLEFKRGGNILEKYMRKVLSKYVCGFLNSEGGQLMIGVDDEGVVQGVTCDHRTEDSFRIMFDQLIRMCEPPVLPPMYRLQFIPVKNERGILTDRKVVTISVKASSSNMLYETPDGEVYIRRDGSLQGPLRAKDVQAWCHLKISGENKDKEKLLKQQIDILEMRLQNMEKSQGQGGQTEQIERSQGQGGQTEQIERSQGQEGQTEQSLHRSVPTNSLGDDRLSPAASSTAMSPQSLKRTNSKFCAIL